MRGDPGIGKSTLLLQALALMSQNQRVLYVGQDTRLFFGTLRENLKAGNPHIDDDSMMRIADAFGVLAPHDPIGHLQHGQAGALDEVLVVDHAVWNGDALSQEGGGFRDRR